MFIKSFFFSFKTLQNEVREFRQFFNYQVMPNYGIYVITRLPSYDDQISTNFFSESIFTFTNRKSVNIWY